MSVVLISTNIGTINAKTLKEIAKAVLKTDLSSKQKDRLEGLRVLSRMCTPVSEQVALKESYPVIGHVYYTFAIAADKDETSFLISLFDGFKLTLIESEGQNAAWIVSGTLDQWLALIQGWNHEILDKVKTILENEGLSFMF